MATRVFFSSIFFMVHMFDVTSGQFQQNNQAMTNFGGSQIQRGLQQNASPFNGFNPFANNQWSNTGFNNGQQGAGFNTGVGQNSLNSNSFQSIYNNNQNLPNVDMSKKDRREEEGWNHLYQFGERYMDIDMVLRPGRDLQIDTEFFLPFFGYRQNYTFIFMEGFIAFSYPEYIQPPYTFPVKGWPKKPDPTVIAPFMMESTTMSVGDDDRLSHVWYRIITRNHRSKTDLNMNLNMMTQQQQQSTIYNRQGYSQPGKVIDPYLLDVMTRDIQEGMVGARGFRADYAILVTWERMAYGGSPKQTDLSQYDAIKKTLNTFQLLVATDEIRTYVLFNYANINWTSSTQAGAFSGRGGKQSALVGFNGGNGTGWYDMPWSANGDSYKLMEFGSTPVAGRWAARVDEDIEYGGCSNDTTGILRMDKNEATMLGGFSINVSASCFRPEDIVRMQIDEETVECNKINRVIARCYVDVKKAFKTGLVSIRLSVDGGKTYPWRNHFYLLMPSMARRQVGLVNDARIQKNSWLNIQADSLNLTWPAVNISTIANSQVDIALYGYYEDAHYPTFKEIGVIARNQPNQGKYAFSPRTLVKTEMLHQYWRSVVGGLVQVRVANFDTKMDNFDKGDIVYWSEPTPLGWYFYDKWRQEYGMNWALSICVDWFEYDGRLPTNFYEELETELSCPCTLKQAEADIGRFVAMQECDNYGNRECRYTTGAKHCVISTRATFGSAGQACCYDFDGYLMFSHDYEYQREQLKFFSPGVPYRGHPWGSQQYKRPPYIPTLSNFYNDLMPYEMCCKWADHCEFYFWRRITSGCQNYRPPALGFVYGSGHFITFDNARYTFNGKGYYTLLHRQKLDQETNVQIRMETPNKNMWNEEVKATVVTGVAAQDKDSDVIEVYARKDFRQWRYKTDVYVNKHRVYFDTAWQKLQQFKGVTIRSLPNNMNMSELEIMFSTGMGLLVTEARGSLNVIVSIPPDYNETHIETMNNRNYVTQTPTGLGRCSSYIRTIGLLGPWNNNKNDDLTSKNCETTSPDANRREIYTKFGQTWRITSDSILKMLFDPNIKALYNPILFVDENFEPDFDDMSTYTRQQSRAVSIPHEHIVHQCQTSKTCAFDYMITGKSEFGMDTLNAERHFEYRKRDGQKLLISCGPLQKNDRVIKTPATGNTYLDGSKVVFTCNPDYFLHGDQQRVCINGTWSPGWWAWCRWRDEEYALKYFTALIVTVMIIAIIVSIFLWCNNIRKKRMNERTRQTNAPRRYTQMPRIGSQTVKSSVVPVFEGDSQKVGVNGTPSMRSINGNSPPKQQQLRFAETSA